MKSFSVSATVVFIVSLLSGTARADTNGATVVGYNTTNCVDYGSYQEQTYAPWEAGSLPGECISLASWTESLVWVSSVGAPVVTLYTNGDCTGATTNLPFRDCINTNGQYASFQYAASD